MNAWVWGGSSGIGYAVAKRLIDQGHHVLVMSRKKPDLPCGWHPFDVDKPIEEIQRHTHQLILANGFHFGAEDIDWFANESPKPIPTRKRWMLERRGAPDLAVLSAGMGAYMNWKQWRDDWWTDSGDRRHAGVDNVMRINALSKAAIAKELLLAMKRRRSGQVLIVGSMMAFHGDHGAEVYAMAQASLEGFVRSASVHPKRHGVTLALVEPGWTSTPMTEVLPAWKKAAAEKRFGEFMTADHVADMMLKHKYQPGEIYPIIRGKV